MITIDIHSIAGLLEESTRTLEKLCSAGQVAQLIVPAHEWGQQRKLQLRDRLSVGVDVQTHRQFITNLWNVYGDGTTIISPEARKVLLRPLITQVGLLDSQPSSKLVDQIGTFVEEAVSPGLIPNSPLSDSQAKVMELVSLYEHKLELEGLVDIVQAESALVQIGACADMHFVFELPDMQSAHIRRFIADIDSVADVVLIRQELFIDADAQEDTDELLELRQRLFTGAGGVRARGHVRVGQAHGAHAASAVIAGLVHDIHEKDAIAYGDMVICPGSLSEAYPRLFETLAQSDIPFTARFSLPCARTGIGAAFCALESVNADGDEDSSFRLLVDLISSPYSGIADEDARALQVHWRERAHSTPQDRLRDIREGFSQGNALPAALQPRLCSLAELLDAPRKIRVELLFTHAREAHLDVDALFDDRSAAEALLDYLELCERFSCDPSMEEMANLPVAIARCFGDGKDGVSLVESGTLGLRHAKAVVLADLDAVHYPMAVQAGPFEDLMINLGIARLDTLAVDQRTMLLNAVEASAEAFAFARATHDVNGDESCQSALFEELVSVYRTKADDDADLPIYGIPAALVPWTFSISEAELFFDSSVGKDERSEDIRRGALFNQESFCNLVSNTRGDLLPFSPTALEDYYRCPYRWFASRRVGYNGIDAKFDPAAQGNLVHAVLERFYTELFEAGFDRVRPSNLSQALEIASNAFEHQLEHDANRARSGLYLRSQYDICACEELRSQVIEFVKRDAEFLPGFKPTYFELSLGHGTGTVLEYAGVPVRGKVDRIDTDDQGNAIIIDYKLSGLSSGYGFARGEDVPQRVQTDIYAVLVQRHFAALGMPLHVIGSVYRSYSKNCMRGVYAEGIIWGEAESRCENLDALPRPEYARTYEEYLAHVEDQISMCMQRLIGGNISPDPKEKGVCDYCKALAFCPRGGA